MKFIGEFNNGDLIEGVYFCVEKQEALTRNRKPYFKVQLRDKTGVIDVKIWDVDAPGIESFSVNDFVEVSGKVNTYQGALQLEIRSIKVATDNTFSLMDYMPSSKKDVNQMVRDLYNIITTIDNDDLHFLLTEIFINDREFFNLFCTSSAAKKVHHAYVGGLLEHTLGVTTICRNCFGIYKQLNYDLLVAAALLHDIGKVHELSIFPENDYTEDGYLFGHIVIGIDMIRDIACKKPDFNQKLLKQLLHCVLAHHGELEFGSPKTPVLQETIVLHYADMIDSRLAIAKDSLDAVAQPDEFVYSKWLSTYMTKTVMPAKDEAVSSAIDLTI